MNCIVWMEFMVCIEYYNTYYNHQVIIVDIAQGHFWKIYYSLLPVKLLLDHGADPNLTDILGNTPLHLG